MIDVDELSLMKEYGDAMNLIRIRHYCFFSKDGYTAELKENATKNIRLITLEEMYQQQGL